jgi:hypothetical protein
MNRFSLKWVMMALLCMMAAHFYETFSFKQVLCLRKNRVIVFLPNTLRQASEKRTTVKKPVPGKPSGFSQRAKEKLDDRVRREYIPKCCQCSNKTAD